MRIRSIFSAALSLFFVMAMPCMAAEQVKPVPWQPPGEMVWHTPNKKCMPTDQYGPFIEACYFGLPDEPTHHAGLAFFRKCAGRREGDPFILVDFQNMEATFYQKKDSPGDTRHLPKSGTINPDIAYELMDPPAGGGPCWAPRGEDT